MITAWKIIPVSAVQTPNMSKTLNPAFKTQLELQRCALTYSCIGLQIHTNCVWTLRIQWKRKIWPNFCDQNKNQVGPFVPQPNLGIVDKILHPAHA